MTMMKTRGSPMMRSPMWVLLGLSLVLAVQGDQQDVQEQAITPKQVSLLGGWSKRSPESEEIQEAALHAVEKFNNQSRAKKTFRLVSITSAQSQVTSMINFKLVAILGKTACLKSDTNDADKCTLAKKRLSCRFELHFNPRKQIHTMEKSSCKKISSSRPTTSPPTSSPPTSPSA